jgi:hypothetical protein
MRWVAGVGETDVLRRYARLFVAQERADGRMDMLMEDGTFTLVEADVHVDRAGIQLAYPALTAIFDALGEWKGLQSHQATETKVLREWLAVERARVDTLIAESTS